jgi:YHS domain-containing protein
MSRFADQPDAETDDSLAPEWHICDTCGNDIDHPQPILFVTTRGDYYFCSDNCLNSFLASLESDGE